MIYTQIFTLQHFFWLVRAENKNKQLTSHRHDSSPDSWLLSPEIALIFGKTGRVEEKPQRITVCVCVCPSDILLVCNSHHFPGAPSGGKGGEPILKQCTVNLLWVKKKKTTRTTVGLMWHYVAFLLFKTHSGLRGYARASFNSWSG